ncbi:MAG: ribosome silencing factor [Clostridia bacterium]|nr:ribosome silencing factor [Clostridia bacterium]
MEARLMAEKIARTLYNKKAQDIIILDVRHLTVITDYMVIASGRNFLQTKALADDVDDVLAEAGVALRSREGKDEGKWIVLDYGSVLVHVFHPEDREYYHLERLWDDGKNRIELDFEEESKDQQ